MARTKDKPDEPKPVFDFSTYSHRVAREVERELARAQRLLALVQDASAFDSEEAFEDTLDQYSEKVDLLESYTNQVLVSVPQEWLVEGAPADLDWTKPESLGWLRQDRYQQLQTMIGDARRPENVSGNSAKH